MSTLFTGIPDAGTWIAGPMMLAIAYTGWAFVGLESAGSIAEEVEEPERNVPKPERNVPKAIILGLLSVGPVVMFSSAALILAIPDLDHVLAERSEDPVATTLFAHFGSGIAKPMLIMFVIGFITSFLAVQAAVSRCIWGAARDRGLPAAGFLGRLAGPERMPINAVGLTAAVAGLLVLLAGSDLFSVLVKFTTIGFYIAFGIPVVGAAVARLTGKGSPGRFTLDRWGAPITYFATLWIILQTINVAWPRTQPDQPWYITWSMVLTTAALALVGAALYLRQRRYITAPVGERLIASAADEDVR